MRSETKSQSLSFAKTTQSGYKQAQFLDPVHVQAMQQHT